MRISRGNWLMEISHFQRPSALVFQVLKLIGEDHEQAAEPSKTACAVFEAAGDKAQPLVACAVVSVEREFGEICRGDVPAAVQIARFSRVGIWRTRTSWLDSGVSCRQGYRVGEFCRAGGQPCCRFLDSGGRCNTERIFPADSCQPFAKPCFKLTINLKLGGAWGLWISSKISPNC